MEEKTALYSMIILVWLSSINAVVVNPGENITEGNCSGKLDYFLCRCTALNATVDIHLTPGRYHFVYQPFCLLYNKTSIKLIGSSTNNTIIDCQGSFNIVLVEVKGVIISNITMVNCGNVLDKFINLPFYNITTTNNAYLAPGFRFAIMFYQAEDVTITKFTMLSTLGYGIVAFNAIGKVTLSEINIENTTFENDPQCKGYDYNSDAADSTCSGSGIFIIYFDHIDLDPLNMATTLIIDHSNFISNKNFLSYKQFKILNDAIDTGFFQTSIPLQGAAGIAIFYLQYLYDVNTTITNSSFCKNNGTLSASIAIGSLASLRGKTLIQNCLFDDNNRINRSTTITSRSNKGGISYYFLELVNVPLVPGAPRPVFVNTTVEIVAIMQCNFTKLGGTAIHIEKISTVSQSLSFKIEQCNFFENEGNVGSAVYAVDHRFDAKLANGLIVNLFNINAENNTLLPGATVDISSTFITGIFHGESSNLNFNCTMECNFVNNQPSVYYGHETYVTIFGKASFVGNTARYGAGLHLIDTVAFIYRDSELYFGKNHASVRGGAINVFYSNTNIQTQDICPIQFIGSSSPILYLENVHEINVNVTFEENTAVSFSSLESIYSQVFYACTWYPNTLIQVNLGLTAQVINGTRQSVYGEVFKYIPANTAKGHLSILAYLPCPCNKDNTYNAQYCLTAGLNDTLELGTTVIVGRSFTISLITLDIVGSIGHSSYLYSKASSNTTDKMLALPREQVSRPFSIVNRACTPIDFKIYALQPMIPKAGILQLSLTQNFDHNLHFTLDECPIGFSLQKVGQFYGCTCGEFFKKSPVKEDFQCNPASGKINRLDVKSFLSVINNRVEYTKLCLPEYCDNSVYEFSLTNNADSLCNHHRSGRACGSCDDSFSKTFGSKFCHKCSNTWLITILLYAILGIILVLIIHLLKLTVTMGTINGLIFFCNIMSINESLFFDPSEFSIVRIFISLINLDLGFEMCFYREMTQIAKTGFQFVFPLYLWLLVFIIIMVGKHYFRSRKSTHSAVPVLATLIFLSYSKLLRTTISVFSSVTVYYSTKESDFSGAQQFVAWQPDPNVKYLEGTHIVLFLVALIFMVFFILPLAFALTFPKVVLRSKKLSYFFPLLDCIYAPYKNQYRYWFGVRIIVLIYFSGMESILFSYQNSLLLSGVVVILLFTSIQAYIHPFKSTINNTLDLMFMEIFITLSIVILYLYPNTIGHEKNIAVNILGGVAFILFCFIMILHLHDAIVHFTWYSKFVEDIKAKLIMKNIKKSSKPLHSVVTRDISHKPDNDDSVNNGSLNRYAYLRESLLEEQFN